MRKSTAVLVALVACAGVVCALAVLTMLGAAAENCDGARSRVDCGAFAKDVAPVLTVLGFVAVIGLAGWLVVLAVRDR